MTDRAVPDDLPEPRRYPPPVREAARGILARWWGRERERTRPLTMLIAGAFAPPVLFLMDRGLGPSAVGPEGVVPFRPYPTLMMAVSVAVLLTWLAARRIDGWGHAVLAGPLLAGGVFALGVGVVLLPLSIVGTLFAGIGLLGLVPFWTAFAYLRAAALAWESARRGVARGPALALAALAAMVVGMGVVGTGRVARLVEFRETAVLTGERPGDPERAEFVLGVLWTFPQVPLTKLREAAMAELQSRQEVGPLAKSYERITGRSAEQYDD